MIMNYIYNVFQQLAGEKKVPIYEYKCSNCGKYFEQIVFPSDNESNLKCTSCGGNNINRIVEVGCWWKRFLEFGNCFFSELCHF